MNILKDLLKNKYLIIFILGTAIGFSGYWFGSCDSNRDRKMLVKANEHDRKMYARDLIAFQNGSKRQNKLEKEKTYKTIQNILKKKQEADTLRGESDKIKLRTIKELKSVKVNGNLLIVQLAECHKKIDLQNLIIDKYGDIINKQGMLLTEMIPLKIYSNALEEIKKYKQLYKSTLFDYDILKKLKLRRSKKFAYGPGCGGNFYPEVNFSVGFYAIWILG